MHILCIKFIVRLLHCNRPPCNMIKLSPPILRIPHNIIPHIFKMMLIPDNHIIE